MLLEIGTDVFEAQCAVFRAAAAAKDQTINTVSLFCKETSISAGTTGLVHFDGALL